MSEKQQVKELMMFELRNMSFKNALGFLYFSLLCIFFLGWFAFSGEFQLVNGSRTLQFSVDIIVIISSMYFVLGVRSKAFKIQAIKGDLYSSPIMILLRTMPFSEKVILKSRIYLYVLLSLIVQSLNMTIVYLIGPELREWITPGLFVVWLIVWNMVTMVIGFMTPASEAGATYSKKYLTIFNLVFFLSFFLGIYALATFSGNGIVAWLLYLTATYPLQTLLSSIIVGIISFILTVHYMKKYMRKVDYHV